ncbi:MAG: hypothetical protein PXY39_14895 [archaeon]|nr:hypothetical protein [archaeon]
MNRTLVIIAGLVALIGVAVNVAVDIDNVYDMTTTALFVLVLILALVGAFVGSKKTFTPAVSSSSPMTDQKR